MADVVLRGPDRELLTVPEVITELGISEGQLVDLLRARLFPPGIRGSPKAPPRWFAADVAAFRYLLSRGCLLHAAAQRREKSEKAEEEDFL